MRPLAERLAIHIRAKQLLKEWDESEHPRDEDGKFAGGGGGGGGGGDGSDDGSTALEAEKPKTEETSSQFSFTHDETLALNRYTGPNAEMLNLFYRNGQKSETLTSSTKSQFKKWIVNINSALKKSNVTQRMTLYRAIGRNKFSLDLIKDHNAEKLVGKELPLGGFQSTSMSKDATSSFMHHGTNIMFRISVEKGTPALNMIPYSGHPEEQEILLGQGSLKVTGVERKPETDESYAIVIIKGKYAARGD